MEASPPEPAFAKSAIRQPFPAELMSTRVNSAKNDDADLLTPVPPDSSESPEQGPNSA